MDPEFYSIRGVFMTFPISPDPSEIDHRGLFLVQDPEICAKLLPLFSFDPLNPEMRPVGHGTAFRIDPWSRCLTAYHVLEHMFELNDSGDGVRLRPDARILALEVNGLIYGTVGLGPEAWRPLAESYALIDIVNQPLQAPQLRNQTELAVIRVHASNPAPEGTPFLHLDFRRWIPTVGEQILAFGFAELDSESDDPNRPINQRVYGSFGHITDIECADGQRGRPWPIMRVEADWPGGMSGGPVFNQEGHVIGLVSTSIAG